MPGSAYLDSSAGVKLVIEEAESSALRQQLSERNGLVSSALFRTELLRAVRHHSPAGLAVARQLLERLTLLTVDDSILMLAAEVEPVALRALDAIHLSSALRLGSELDVLVTYDRRMIEAAQRLGLPVASPT